MVALHHAHEDLKGGGALTVTLREAARQDFSGLEVRLEVDAAQPRSALMRNPEDSVEWALAQRLIEMHGGLIEITSKEGEGTTVTCILPTQPVLTANGSDDEEA